MKLPSYHNYKLQLVKTYIIFYFYLYKYINGVTGYTFLGSSIRKVLLLSRFLIFFKVAFSQYFFTPAGNMVTSAKLLGSGTKWDTYETDSPKLDNTLFGYFTTTLKTLCKPFPILFTGSYAPFHSLCACLI